MSEIDRLQKRFEREKKARHSAESILEQISQQLFERNQQLVSLSNDLERQVTERTKDLTKARDLALQAAKAKSEFIANMSHEIRTPLNGILGILNILSKADLATREKELVGTARWSGKHLLDIVNEILDFSKIEAGKLQLDPCPISLPKLITAAAQSFETQCQDQGIVLHLDIEPGFPEWVMGDPHHIRQIINNLVSNAVKFTKQGSVTLRLTKQKSAYQIQVTDTGIGMTEQQLAKIFTAFDQADTSTTREYGGTGLGLTITQRIVHLMGGRIEVKSQRNSGSTFTVILPLTLTEKPEHDQTNIEQQGMPQFNQQPILLVEDNEINQLIASTMLEDANLNVSICNNGAEALDAVQQKDYQLVFMDLQMPVMGGLEATDKIRQLGGKFTELPIIAMTAHASQEHIDETKRHGMQGHLSKPIEPTQVYQCLVRFLSDAPTQVLEPQMDAQPDATNPVNEALPGIDLQDVLNRIKGNKKLLGSLLQQFRQDQQQCWIEISDLIDSNDWPAAKSKAHTLKGSAANLGMQPLSEIASRLDQQLKQQSAENTPELLSQLEAETKQVLASIETFLQIESNPQSGDTKQDTTTENTISALEHIAIQIKTDFPEAESRLNTLMGYAHDEAIATQLDQLAALMDQFELDKAEQQLTDILEMMREGKSDGR
jgi:signal transduction histidine kinase/CheY-like chemotaxis protein